MPVKHIILDVEVIKHRSIFEQTRAGFKVGELATLCAFAPHEREFKSNLLLEAITQAVKDGKKILYLNLETL